MKPTAVTASCETHLSQLLFTADRVYKLLKPVVLPFVDFSDTQTRIDAATQEFQRNQGISPDVYLGLADVYEDNEMVDRMIVMRRLPADRELRALLGTGNDSALIQLVARHVAAMHADLMPLRGSLAEPASPQAIAANWEDNLAAIAPHVGPLISSNDFDEVAGLARSYIEGRDALFAARIEAGWVRDGHGDIRAEHLYCTDDGPRMIDCVAFDDRLRIADALADVAFLAMDLDRLVGASGAVELMEAWDEFTGEHHPSSLAHFYVAYRAHVRCKIACLRHQGGSKEAAVTARAYHDQALRHLRLARIRLVLVGGGPGSGKSTVAEGVAGHVGAAWLRADEVRKDVAGIGHSDHAFAAPNEGIYAPHVSAKMRTELIRQTRLLLTNGVSVVLDATWHSEADRQMLRDVATECAATMSELCCVLPAEIARERIARRMASIYNPSDATPELVDVLGDQFDPWPTAVEIDTRSSVGEAISAACSAISPGATVAVVGATARFTIDLTALRDHVLIDGGID